MTTADLLKAVVDSGGAVIITSGQPRIVGPVPSDLVAAIRADRDAFLEAWNQYERDRYCKCPPANLPMRNVPPKWRKDVYARVEGYASRQGPEILRWVVDRAASYMAGGMDDESAMKSSLHDLLHWQMARQPDPEQLLKDFEELR